MNASKSQIAMSAVRIIVAALLGFFLFAMESSVGMSLKKLSDPFLSNIWAMNSISFAVGLALCILIMLALSKGKISTYGLKLAEDIQLIRIIILSLGIGIIANLIGYFLPGEGLTFLEEYSFLQVVVFACIYRSVFEETVYRGLVQSFLAPLIRYGFTVAGIRVSLPVLVSALLFALVHMMLLTIGIDILTVLGIVLFGFILGIIAGYFREKTGSLIPAIAVHMFFNISGSITDFLLELL